MRIDPSSEARTFLISQGATEETLRSASFRVLNLQLGDALTVVWPGGKATIYLKSRFLQPDESGQLPVNRSLALIRHELHHVEQGHNWGFTGYWARHLWARVRHLSVAAKSSSVEAPAYEIQRAAYAALDEMGVTS